jgi:hypothetical protein
MKDEESGSYRSLKEKWATHRKYPQVIAPARYSNNQNRLQAVLDRPFALWTLLSQL